MVTVNRMVGDRSGDSAQGGGCGSGDSALPT